jgi:hypothetical protein
MKLTSCERSFVAAFANRAAWVPVGKMRNIICTQKEF